MKIQCNACEAAEAKVLCCADEAALCWECDDKVHAANKLASKHQRVPLLSSSSSRVPKCDICQEASGYFFCLEDRALLCRNCDISVHTANPCVSIHQRFLLTGVQVGLEATGLVPSGSKDQSTSAKAASEPSPKQPKSQAGIDGCTGPPITYSVGSSMTGSIPEWPLDEIFRFTDFNHNFEFTDYSSSKANSGKNGSSDGSSLSCSFDEDVDAELLVQVPDIPSPPTASGLHWPKSSNHLVSEIAAFVPEIISSQNLLGYPTRTALSKRRRSRHG
ncbi:hypothetical protein HPP92_009874 [Vanilla planifolia]|uniref:B box-type domain-containing protein n=1 Tax=Vanilla planifolia TaxID=51239 RepID=A0A835R5C4_VANPL|nr:hypothetical protein HPP92_009874 [Vanilla planifolia]